MMRESLENLIRSETETNTSGHRNFARLRLYRNLNPKLAGELHVIAPDYIGFGYSDAPKVSDFSYTFDNLATHLEELLFGVLGLKRLWSKESESD